MDSQSQGGGPNFLGGGMYVAPNYDINQGAMTNPNYQGPAAYNNAVGNFLGATTQPVVNAATASPVTQTNYNTGTAGQLGMANKYAAMANGQGPSLATVQAQQQGAANLQSAESMLGSARGAGNPAQAQLAARNAQATGANTVAQNAVAGRTQEEMNAMGGAVNAYGSVAGQGINSAQLTQQGQQFNAGQANTVAMANQANNLAANTTYLGNVTNQGLAQQQGTIAGQQLAVQQQLGLGQIGATSYQNAASNNEKIAGSALSAAGGVAGAML
jgi:hypothetical protein